VDAVALARDCGAGALQGVAAPRAHKATSAPAAANWALRAIRRGRCRGCRLHRTRLRR
jgi:hypothetical protein